jgi:hypothetical protein
VCGNDEDKDEKEDEVGRRVPSSLYARSLKGHNVGICT